VMGLHNDVQFQNYHRVLNRVVWSSRAASWPLMSTTATSGRDARAAAASPSPRPTSATTAR
jgi:hypothetical protein